MKTTMAEKSAKRTFMALGNISASPRSGRLATKYNDPALLRAVLDRKGNIVAYGRTRLGQTLYDVLFSSMSAAEAARRHHLKREFVLSLRRKHKAMIATK